VGFSSTWTKRILITFSSVIICKLFTFQFYFCSQIIRLNGTKACLLWWSSIIYLRFFFTFWYQTWLESIMLSDWMKFQISCLQKPNMWWKCYIVGLFLTWPRKNCV
jgi:hypothetical protein